jgi:phosphate transport system protein
METAMKKFEQELATLKDQVMAMGRVSASMLTGATRALVEGDAEIIRRVLADEPRVDQFQVDIDSEVIRLITIYSPIARDLRFLLMVARINTELERIADQAVNNCEFIQQLLAEPSPRPLDDLTRMSDITRTMLDHALDAFRDEDTQTAERVLQMDDDVDDLNSQTFRDLLAEGTKNPQQIRQSMTLSLLARSLERMADHATNICEEVIYMVRGEDVRHQG